MAARGRPRQPLGRGRDRRRQLPPQPPRAVRRIGARRLRGRRDGRRLPRHPAARHRLPRGARVRADEVGLPERGHPRANGRHPHGGRAALLRPPPARGRHGRASRWRRPGGLLVARPAPDRHRDRVRPRHRAPLRRGVPLRGPLSRRRALWPLRPRPHAVRPRVRHRRRGGVRRGAARRPPSRGARAGNGQSPPSTRRGGDGAPLSTGARPLVAPPPRPGRGRPRRRDGPRRTLADRRLGPLRRCLRRVRDSPLPARPPPADRPSSGSRRRA